MFEALKGLLGKQEVNESSAAEATANEFIGVKDIRGSILYTRSNEVFTYIKVQSVSMGLLSAEEKKTFINTMTNVISNETKPFRLQIGRASCRERV